MRTPRHLPGENRLGHLYPAKGMSSKGFTVFVADQLEVGERSREQEGQDMRQGWSSELELQNMIRSGIVTDDSTIAAYRLYQPPGGNRTAD